MNQNSAGNMSAYYDRQFSAEDMQRLTEMSNGEGVMGMMGGGGLDMSGSTAAAVDQMMQRQQPNKDIQRRRSFHTGHQQRPNRYSLQEPDPRRSSMLEFGSGNNGDLDGFQFDPGPAPTSGASLQRSNSFVQRKMDAQRGSRSNSDDGLALNTSFPNMSGYSSMPNTSTFHQPHSADSLGFDMSAGYMTNNMLMGLDFSNGMDHGQNGGITPRSAFPGNTFSTGIQNSPGQQSMQHQMSSPMHDPGGGNIGHEMGTPTMMDKMADQDNQLQRMQADMQARMSQQSMAMQNQTSNMGMATESVSGMNQMSKNQNSSNNLDISANLNGLRLPAQNDSLQQQVIPQYRNAYSSSGFDMLGVLMRVAARPNPQISIGAVDMSCAFVVCDVTSHDIPIVYCSDVFERLTAYTRHEILGRNCRFLQAPDGKIKAGTKRKYVDDDSVWRIKKLISGRQEAQVSVINYRKGGQPFMNLLTMIPITWDSDEIKYYVGFQVDLVEQPSSVTNKNPGTEPLDRLLSFH